MLLCYLISLFPLELRHDTLSECILRLVPNVKAYTSMLSFHHILVNIFNVANPNPPPSKKKDIKRRGVCFILSISALKTDEYKQEFNWNERFSVHVWANSGCQGKDGWKTNMTWAMSIHVFAQVIFITLLCELIHNDIFYLGKKDKTQFRN